MKLKPHTNMLRPGVLFIFSLHLFYESLSLGSLPHPHHHQGLVVTLVCQGALQEEGKHTHTRSIRQGNRSSPAPPLLLFTQKAKEEQRVEGGNDSSPVLLSADTCSSLINRITAG